MSVVAFVVLAFMLGFYVLLDGYDLGAAAVAPLVARNDRERWAAMESIGPFWNGNEVWLVVAGASLFALFPRIYASSFSGFYLPFMVVLWLLMFRGIAMELRGHFPSDLWHQFWDAAFTLASALLILLFGIALGNLVRGVPLDASGYFQGTFGFLLNPYALLVGALALAALGAHGSTFLALRIDGELAARCLRMAQRSWWIVVVLYVAASAATFLVRGRPTSAGLYAVPIASLVALAAMGVALRRGRAGAAFAGSCAFLATLLVEVAVTLFPYLLPAYPPGHGGLSIYDSPPSSVALTTALVVTIAGSVAALAYGSVVWRRMAGKIRVE